MIEYRTEPGAADEDTIIREGGSGGVADLLALATALVLFVIASFAWMGVQHERDSRISAQQEAGR